MYRQKVLSDREKDLAIIEEKMDVQTANMPDYDDVDRL